jgi:hypothetical protein
MRLILMMKKTKIATALTSIFAGSLLSLAITSEASAHVMYNTYNAYSSNLGSDEGANSIDGWTNQASSGWVGTASSSTKPFDTTADVVNWAAHLHGAGSLTVSSQDAFDDYGVWADIDTAKGAWNDKGPNGPTSGGSQGWGHNTDVGLFKSNITQTVTITASNLVSSSWQNFGISIFSGMSTAGNWDHHGGWNTGYRPASHANPNLAPAQQNNPLSSVGLTYITHTDDSTVSFEAQAGQVYSILLGGYSGAGNFGPHAGYSLSISSVPVPGAVWLFVSAMFGLVGFQRRKQK